MEENTKAKKVINYDILLLATLLFILLSFFVDLVPGKPEITLTATVAIYMAILWMTEAVPIGLTSLLPLILFPLLGILNGTTVANTYVNWIIFLFIGGFLMALALEKWNVHRRIALRILSYLGGSPLKILAGFIIASAFLSMWISNTATAMMMLPIAMSVIRSLEEIYGEKKLGKFNIALLLGIAYGCSIGGLATLIGTPPNLAFARIMEIIYPDAPEIAFGKWFVFAFPITFLMFFMVIALLYFLFSPGKELVIENKSFFKNKYSALGPTTIDQKRVLVLFSLLIFMWIFRKNLVLGDFIIPGWSEIMPHPEFINDGTIAIFVAIILFLIPTSNKENKSALLTWEIVPKIPWGIIALFGGGFALAKAFDVSGLSAYAGAQLSSSAELGVSGLLFTIISLMVFLTEFTSNTASTQVMLPIIAGIANEIRLNPLYLMIPMTIAASLAFMLPVATPPNAVVFGSGKLKIKDMVKAGIIMNIIAIVVVFFVFKFWGTVVFDIDPSFFPEWALEADVEK